MTTYLILVVFILFGIVSCKALPYLDNTAEESSTDSTDIFETRIVGGKEAEIEDHPYQVSYIVNKTYFCGGFIVNETIILTAAHCAQDVDPSTVVLRAGSSWRTNGTTIPIAEVIPHPGYNDPAFDKDVAVMKTVDPIKFTDTIQPIALPAKGTKLIAGSKVIVSGWGKQRFTAISISEHLMSVVVPVIDHSKCSRAYNKIMTENMWCGGYFYFGGKGACQGDSGGAVIQDGVAYGIVSWGRFCAHPFSPTVFADIAAPTNRDFITEYTKM